MNKQTKQKIGRRSRRGSVMLIAFILLLSASFRIISNAKGALAEATQVDTSSQRQDQNTELDRNKLSKLLNELRDREQRLQLREQEIEVHSKALSVANEEIEKRIQTLKRAEEALRETLALADNATEKDLAQLTSVYESMKPKVAAALFEAMEPEFAAGFLGRMRPDSAAAIMAGLSAEAGYSISVILAGRNANAPKS